MKTRLILWMLAAHEMNFAIMHRSYLPKPLCVKNEVLPAEFSSFGIRQANKLRVQKVEVP